MNFNNSIETEITKFPIFCNLTFLVKCGKLNLICISEFNICKLYTEWL